MIGASLFIGQAARAEIDYEGVKYLGGGDKIDLNNANIRAYLKVPGLYPTLASKIVTNGPFKTVADVYNIPGLSGAEKDLLKKAESRFVTLDVKPEYEIDKINNGCVFFLQHLLHFNRFSWIFSTSLTPISAKL
jgi:photosystem II PsbU protein